METERAPSRDEIVEAIVGVVEPLDYVYAVWEGGAVAFGRVDEWSDIDICADADDERVSEPFPVVEAALTKLAPIELKYEMKAPALGDYVQAFYRLKGTSKFMLIDFAVFRHSAKDKLLEPEIHGKSRFHFNKNGAVKIPALNREKFLQGLKDRVQELRSRYETFGCFVEKEINRGNWIEALGLYHRITLESLVEILRMKHMPVRYRFRTRYVHHDLPPEIVTRLNEYYFVSDEDDLRAKQGAVEAWLREALNTIDFDEIAARL
jgi:hypothetical protein